jgi:cytochrome c biogenesis protein CcmG/thiol:disulfide interchange protein DsbE
MAVQTRARHTARWIAVAVGIVFVAFAVVFAVVLQERPASGMPRLVQEHGPAPEFETTTLDGSSLSSADLEGKSYVVNVWNTWCLPCQEEEPALREFYERHEDDPDFAMIGLVREDERGPVQDIVDEGRVTWPVVFDEELLTAFGTTGQPETYVISPDGVAVCGRLGASTVDELETWLDAARTGKMCT